MQSEIDLLHIVKTGLVFVAMRSKFAELFEPCHENVVCEVLNNKDVDWSVPLLVTCNKVRFSHIKWQASIMDIYIQLSMGKYCFKVGVLTASLSGSKLLFSDKYIVHAQCTSYGFRLS